MALPSLPADSERVAWRYRRIQRLVTVLVCLGLLVQSLGNQAFRFGGFGTRPAWIGAWAAGTLFHLAACVLYVRLKGRKPWIGLLGLLGIFGVLALVFMENECHRCGRREKKQCRDCPSCGAPM